MLAQKSVDTRASVLRVTSCFCATRYIVCYGYSLAVFTRCILSFL